MSEQPEQMNLPSVDAWRGEFMEAAVAYDTERRSRPWWRRWWLPFVIAIAIASGGYATARLIDYVSTDPALPPFRGEIHAFVNLKTGEPIRCPDGSMLISKPEKGSHGYYPAHVRCPDGTEPKVYRQQLHALMEFLDSKAAAHTSIQDEPRFEFQPKLDSDGNPLPEEVQPLPPEGNAKPPPGGG